MNKTIFRILVIAFLIIQTILSACIYADLEIIYSLLNLNI